MPVIIKPQTRMIDIRREGDRVIIIEAGRLVFDLPWRAALEMGKALIFQAHKAEEIEKAGQIAFDQGVLIRAGANIGLTNNPAILDEAGKEAAWNTKIRRAMPGGIKSQEAFGTPRIIRHKPKKGVDHG